MFWFGWIYSSKPRFSMLSRQFRCLFHCNIPYMIEKQQLVSSQCCWLGGEVCYVLQGRPADPSSPGRPQPHPHTDNPPVSTVASATQTFNHCVVLTLRHLTMLLLCWHGHHLLFRLSTNSHSWELIKTSFRRLIRNVVFIILSLCSVVLLVY